MSLKIGFVITSTTGETFRLIADSFSGATSKLKSEHNIGENDIKGIEQTPKISSFSL